VETNLLIFHGEDCLYKCNEIEILSINLRILRGSCMRGSCIDGGKGALSIGDGPPIGGPPPLPAFLGRGPAAGSKGGGPPCSLSIRIATSGGAGIKGPSGLQ
jgi:hypothetical protein